MNCSLRGSSDVTRSLSFALRFQSGPTFLFSLDPSPEPKYEPDLYVGCGGARLAKYDTQKEAAAPCTVGKETKGVSFFRAIRSLSSHTIVLQEVRLRCHNKTGHWLLVQCTVEYRMLTQKCGCPPLEDSPAFRADAGRNRTRSFVFAAVVVPRTSSLPHQSLLQILMLT